MPVPNTFNMYKMCSPVYLYHQIAEPSSFFGLDPLFILIPHTSWFGLEYLQNLT